MKNLPTILLMVFVSLCHADIPTVEEFQNRLEGRLVTVQTIQSDFLQTREIPALELKLEFTGHLAYEAIAKRLMWRVEKPLRCAFRIQDDKLSQWDGETGKTLSIKASQFPWLRLLQERLAQWLSGDLEVLRKEADVQVLSQYRVRLIPRDGLLATLTNAVELEFSEDYERVAEIRLEEKSGDVLTIQFQNTLLNQPIPEETWQG